MPTLKAFEKLVVDREMMTWPAAVPVKYVNLRRVRNQIERIRAEDSHLGEDIGECLIARVCCAGNDFEDVIMSFSRPASPLSGGKVAANIVITN